MIDRLLPTLLTLAAGFGIAVLTAAAYVAVDRWQRRREARRRLRAAVQAARLAPALATITPAFAAMADAARTAGAAMAQVRQALEQTDKEQRP